MQGMVSDKTFHLKWNNHLQNLSQLFTTIYSSSALADVTLSCRDGTLKAHKLVLSACSPYFEQIFRENPCQHPIVILKGIPFSEINLLVEFMYKGSVDVQELDLQSLMHTASELEIRGLAYEARDNAAQLLNVNLEYPSYQQNVPSQSSYPAARTDVERLKQIHMYQQSMMRAEEIRRRRREDTPTTHTAVNNILAAAAREMEEARARGGDRVVASIQTEHDQCPPSTMTTSTPDVKRDPDDDRPKKRASISSPDDDRLKKKKMTVRFQDDSKTDERPNKITSPGAQNEHPTKNDTESKHGGIKVVQLAALQKPSNNTNNEHDDSDEKAKAGMDDDEETDSSGSMSDIAANDSQDTRPHVCDVCDLRFQRSSHLSRHRLTHTGERPFACGGCGRSFARSDKLRVHTKICERDDPTIDMAANDVMVKRENSSEVMSGMVRTTHRESGHLVFTASGDVMLPPRAGGPPAGPPAAGGAGAGGPGGGAAVPLGALLEPRDVHELGEPPRRGRGRPRKTPLPLTPKIKKKRGRPPKTSLDMEGCVLTSGTVLGSGGLGAGVGAGGAGGVAHVSPAHASHLLLKRKRGRPPKNYLMTRPGMDMAIPMEYGLVADLAKIYGRPNENYNATNLPFGDFSYLTEMMYNPLAYGYGVPAEAKDPEPEAGADAEAETETDADATLGRTIDVSDTSTDEDEPRADTDEHAAAAAAALDATIMTVGDCQIVKLPPGGGGGGGEEEDPPAEEAAPGAPPTAVTITPISTVGDCTVRPADNT